MNSVANCSADSGDGRFTVSGKTNTDGDEDCESVTEEGALEDRSSSLAVLMFNPNRTFPSCFSADCSVMNSAKDSRFFKLSKENFDFVRSSERHPGLESKAEFLESSAKKTRSVTTASVTNAVLADSPRTGLSVVAT